MGMTHEQSAYLEVNRHCLLIFTRASLSGVLRIFGLVQKNTKSSYEVGMSVKAIHAKTREIKDRPGLEP